MRTISNSAIPQRALKLTCRVGLAAILVGLGACSNFVGLRSPIFTGSTNQKQIIAGQPAAPLGGAYAGVQAGAVQGADLPPPVGAGAGAIAAYTPPAAYAPQPGPQPYTPPAQPLQIAQAPAPQALGAPPTTLNEQAARIQPAVQRGSATHTVQPGDTAWNISRRYGVSVAELAAANGGSTTVKLGSRLVIPGANAPQAGVQMASLNPQATPVAVVAPIAPPVPPA
ncbi:MAG: LysM peptidoglycan-binding domain-containing protein, partial [Propylenella sp.]